MINDFYELKLGQRVEYPFFKNAILAGIDNRNDMVILKHETGITKIYKNLFMKYGSEISERKNVYIKVLKTSSHNVEFIVKDLNGETLGIYKWKSRNYNSQLCNLNDFTKVSATIISNGTLKNIRMKR